MTRVQVIKLFSFLFITHKDAPDLVMDIDSFKESIKVDTHPLHHLRCSFEEGCLAPEVNEVWGRSGFHNRHLLKFTSRFINKGAVTFRPNIDKSSWKYHQCHEHFHSMETFATYDLIGEFFTIRTIRDWLDMVLLSTLIGLITKSSNAEITSGKYFFVKN